MTVKAKDLEGYTRSEAAVACGFEPLVERSDKLDELRQWLADNPTLALENERSVTISIGTLKQLLFTSSSTALAPVADWYREHTEADLRREYQSATDHDAPDHIRGESFERWAEAEGYIRGDALRTVFAPSSTAQWFGGLHSPLADVLRGHYLSHVHCNHETKQDNAICACSKVHLGWHPTVGEAVESWINHVLTELNATPSATTFALTKGELDALIDYHDWNDAGADAMEMPEAAEHHAKRSKEFQAMRDALPSPIDIQGEQHG